jgi:hypothetical protein
MALLKNIAARILRVLRGLTKPYVRPKHDSEIIASVPLLEITKSQLIYTEEDQ